MLHLDANNSIAAQIVIYRKTNQRRNTNRDILSLAILCIYFITGHIVRVAICVTSLFAQWGFSNSEAAADLPEPFCCGVRAAHNYEILQRNLVAHSPLSLCSVSVQWLRGGWRLVCVSAAVVPGRRRRPVSMERWWVFSHLLAVRRSHTRVCLSLCSTLAQAHTLSPCFQVRIWPWREGDSWHFSW